MRQKWRDLVAAVKRAFDLNDLFVFGGIALAGFGIYQIDPPAAYIVVGVTFVWLGKFR